MPVLIDSIKNNPEDFQKIHNERIGSSKISAICGLNPYYTPLQVFMEMTGRQKPFQGNDFTWLGTKMQPIIGELFSRRSGLEVTELDQVYVHPEYDFLISSPDFAVQDGGLAETKNTGIYAKALWEDGAPDSAQLQLQMQLEIVGRPHGYCVALIGGNPNDLKYSRFERSPQIFEQILKKAKEFLALVKADTPPAPMAGDEELITLLQGDKLEGTAKLHPDELPAFVQLELLLEQRKASREEEKELSERIEEIQNRLRLLGKGAGSIICGKYELEITKRSRKAFEAKAAEWLQFKLKEKK